MRRSILLTTLVSFAACGDEAPTADLNASGPLALDDALAYFDAGTASLIIVDPAGAAGPGGHRRLLRVAVGETPVLALSVPRPDDPTRHQILISDPGGEQVIVVRDKSGATTALDVGVPLEALDVAADGRYALAYQPDGATPSRSLFAFPNTVAVIDLDPDAPKATPLLLGSSGARPLRAVFARSMRLSTIVSINGEPTTVTTDVPLALVFIKGGIVPVDLAKGVAGAVVPLTPSSDRDVIPAEVLFTNNEGDRIRGTLDNIERAFVRTTAGELYVFAISLSAARLTDDPDAMDVMVALENVITPDATVEDVELFFDDDGRELLLAAAGNELILVDGYTSVASRFPQTVHVDTLVRFQDPITGSALALGYSRARPDTNLLRLDPLGLDRRRSTGVEVLRLGSPIVDIDVAGGATRAVLEYADGRDLGVLELERAGSVLDMRFARRLSARSLSPAGDRLWLVSRSPEDDQPHLAEVELGNSLAVREVRLDRDAVAVGRAGHYLWVDHGDPAGSVTFFPDDDLRRRSAMAIRGILYFDLLNLPSPDPQGGAAASGQEGDF